MLLEPEDLKGVPGAAKRRSLMVDLAVDVLINLAEPLFEKCMEKIKAKRARKGSPKAVDKG